MPRLGELLVAAGVIGQAQLEEGLRAQVIHGARLGTNLVELGHAELDDIAVALARKHGLPPALHRHFERCDPDVQGRLPAAIAAPYLVVPIGFLSGNRARVMLACRDPLPPAAIAMIEDALDLGPGGVVQAICAELRILYFLERVYAVPRANRFLRVRRATSADPPAVPRRHDTFGGGDTGGFGGHSGFGGSSFGGFGTEPSAYRSFEDATGRFAPAPQQDSEEDFDASDDRATTAGFARELADFSLPDAEPFDPSPDFHIEETPVEHVVDSKPARIDNRRPATEPPYDFDEPVPRPVREEVSEVSLVAIPFPLPMDGEEARRFVETVADPLPAAPTLGRMKIRRVALKSSGEVEEVEMPSVVQSSITLDDVARAIRRGDSRDRVGDLAVGALRRFGENRLTAVIIFVLREAVAIGWKGHVVDSELSIEDLAVPLDAPTVLAAAARERRALLIDAQQGTELDQRLWKAIGQPTPGQVAVAPVVLADTPVCLIYGQGDHVAPLAELFAAVTQATTTALARLLRAAQR